jgi:hypothetical protein
MTALQWSQVHAWRMSQHGLSPRFSSQDFLQVVTRTAGIQAQVKSAAELALCTRVEGLAPRDVKAAIFQDRTLVKTWAMRGTLHLLAASELPLYVAARDWQLTCGRLLELNRNLYELEKPKRSPHPNKEMPFRASFRHQYWSVDVRYIEKHHIPDHEGPVYLISILENYSRAVLASQISPTQNQWDYLEVLFAALSTAGVPKAVVSDGGAIFYCNQALHVYQELGIEKLRIEKKQSWQNYIETMFNIVRRMADVHFYQAASWVEMEHIHQKWVRVYNTQRH